MPVKVQKACDEFWLVGVNDRGVNALYCARLASEAPKSRELDLAVGFSSFLLFTLYQKKRIFYIKIIKKYTVKFISFSRSSR